MCGKKHKKLKWVIVLTSAMTLSSDGVALAQKPAKQASSYMPVDQNESFQSVKTRMEAAKAAIANKHQELLEERYDLADHAAEKVTMSRGKPVQSGTRAKLLKGITWDKLNALSPQQIREQNLFPLGFLPFPHPNHPEGGMLFPKFHIAEVKKQEGRDLTRFDLEFDLPDRFLPEFPPPIYLTTRLDLGDVSQGQLVTNVNYFGLFNGILNPKQLEGLRLLVTPFMQQQFNQTDDRRSELPSRGVACFDCHANGHTNAATHLV